MKTTFYTYTPKLILLTVFISLFTVSCGDDPVSADEEPPVLPSFEQIEPDLSYFDQEPEKANGNASPENYYQAKSYATSLQGVLSLGREGSGFLLSADQSEAKFRDGDWVWDYNYSHQGQTVDITLVATEAGDDILWTMTMSYDDGNGVTVEDHLVLEGRVAKDGNSGTWTFNAINEETSEEIPALITNWTRTSEDEIEVSTEFYDGTELSGTFEYKESGNEFTLSLSGLDTENDIIIFWDTDSMTGYYQVGDDRNCWDSEFQNVACG